MKNLTPLWAALAVVAALDAQAFLGFGNSSTNKPPKLHVLMQPANDYIEEAQLCELNGDADKALENYRKALEELNRVASENPDRADTAEFAPLRNKAAVCAIQIDNIRLEQVNANERRVAVTDTRELQKKYNEKHGLTNRLESAAVAAPAPAAKTEAAPAPVRSPEDEAREKAADFVEDAKDAIADGRPLDAKKSLSEALKIDPESWDARYLMAYTHVSLGDLDAAEMLLGDVLEDRPNNVSALLLRGAVQMTRGDHAAAQKTVTAAIRANPDYYAGYYNMATLLVEMGSSRETARKFYEQGRLRNGPRDPDLEKALGEDGK